MDAERAAFDGMAADMWAAGCLTVECLTGRPMWCGRGPKGVWTDIFEKCGMVQDFFATKFARKFHDW